MAISNYIPSSRIAQSGVCTSSTRPASPFEGQMIYETDTNRVLVWDNAAWVMIADTDEPPGLQLIASNTFTNAANPFINGCFSSDYENYLVKVVIETSAIADAYFRMRSGVNTPETGAVYDRYGFQAGASSTYVSLIGGNLVAAVIADTTNSALTTTRTTGDIQIYGPNETKHTMTTAVGWGSQTGAIWYPSHRIETLTAYTGIELTTLSATTLTGTMRVYGYRD
jgi:hypothetical protein